MKISCNVKQGTSLVKNSSQTVEIKDKTNEKKAIYHKLDASDKKANTNTSPEMKISCNVKQGTFLVKNSSQTVEIKDKTNDANNHKATALHKAYWLPCLALGDNRCLLRFNIPIPHFSLVSNLFVWMSHFN